MPQVEIRSIQKYSVSTCDFYHFQKYNDHSVVYGIQKIVVLVDNFKICVENNSNQTGDWPNRDLEKPKIQFSQIQMKTTQKYNRDYCFIYSFFVWFSLVSLFNGISTFVGYLTPNPSFQKNSNGTRRIWGFIPFPRVFVRLEFELTYYDSTVHHFNHYTTRTPFHFLFTITRNYNIIITISLWM